MKEAYEQYAEHRDEYDVREQRSDQETGVLKDGRKLFAVDLQTDRKH